MSRTEHTYRFKLDAIDLASAIGVGAAASQLNVNRKTMSTWMARKEKIRERVNRDPRILQRHADRPGRPVPSLEMEAHLGMWLRTRIALLRQEGLPFTWPSFHETRDTASKICGDLYGDPNRFAMTDNWFIAYLNRFVKENPL